MAYVPPPPSKKKTKESAITGGGDVDSAKPPIDEGADGGVSCPPPAPPPAGGGGDGGVCCPPPPPPPLPDSGDWDTMDQSEEEDGGDDDGGVCCPPPPPPPGIEEDDNAMDIDRELPLAPEIDRDAVKVVLTQCLSTKIKTSKDLPKPSGLLCFRTNAMCESVDISDLRTDDGYVVIGVIPEDDNGGRCPLVIDVFGTDGSIISSSKVDLKKVIRKVYQPVAIKAKFTQSNDKKGGDAKFNFFHTGELTKGDIEYFINSRSRESDQS
eukprot:GHVN01099701.1.p1 GENE.GHVN01099701.1~~GHVN01099701.1.p1  ORF type:complete len:287 (+),score=81.12 GHVN01099701.1:61-861(+)